MIFSSNIFLFTFLPITLVVYLAVHYFRGFFGKSTNTSILNLILFIASMFFFFWGSGTFTLVFVSSIFFNFYVGELLWLFSSGSLSRKYLFALGVGANLILLSYFKYRNFFFEEFSGLLSVFGITYSFSISEHFLPFGISFFTFMSISYLFECFRRETRATSALNFSTYMAMFPHLIAGPIVRYSEIASELENRKLNIQAFNYGIWRFSVGMFKKIVIAGYAGQAADKIFALPQTELTPFLAWGGAFAYSIQIYFDFSGYSDMAIGLARFFGFHFPENFNRPYIATSITDFWRRWHISLSLWFRDFLYIPLGGNRKGAFRTYCNLMIVFVLCGLWHGAAWHFIVWGAYHGVLLMAERALLQRYQFKTKGILGGMITLFLVVIGWVLFRAENLTHAANFLSVMLSPSGIYQLFVGPTTTSLYTVSYYFNPLVLTALFIGAFVAVLPRTQSDGLKAYHSILTLPILLLSIVVLSKAAFSPFIYFQF